MASYAASSKNKRVYFDPAKYSGPTNIVVNDDEGSDNSDEDSSDDWNVLLDTEGNPSFRCEYCVSTINMAKLRGLKRNDRSIKSLKDCLCQRWFEKSIEILSSIEMSYCHDPVPAGFFKRIRQAFSSFFKSILEDIKTWRRRLKDKSCDENYKNASKTPVPAINSSPEDCVEREKESPSKETTVTVASKAKNSGSESRGGSGDNNSGVKKKSSESRGGSGDNNSGVKEKSSESRGGSGDNNSGVKKKRKREKVVLRKGSDENMEALYLRNSEYHRGVDGSLDLSSTYSSSFTAADTTACRNTPQNTDVDGATGHSISDAANDAEICFDEDGDEIEAYIEYEMRITTRSAFYEYPVPVTRYRKKHRALIDPPTSTSSNSRRRSIEGNSDSSTNSLERTNGNGVDPMSLTDPPRRKISTFGFSYIDPTMFVEYPSLKGHMHKLVPRPTSPPKMSKSKSARLQRRASQPSFLTASFPQNSSLSSNVKRPGSTTGHLRREACHRRYKSLSQQQTSGFSDTSSNSKSIAALSLSSTPPSSLSSSFPSKSASTSVTSVFSSSTSMPSITPLWESSSMPANSSSHQEIVLTAEMHSPDFNTEHFSTHDRRQTKEPSSTATGAKVINAVCHNEVTNIGTNSTGCKNNANFDEVVTASSHRSCYNKAISASVSCKHKFNTRPASTSVNNKAKNNAVIATTIAILPISMPSHNESQHYAAPLPSMSSSAPSMKTTPSPLSLPIPSPTSSTSFEFNYSNLSPTITSAESGESKTDTDSHPPPALQREWSWGASGCFDVVNSTSFVVSSQISEQLSKASVHTWDNNSDDTDSDAESETKTLIHPSGRSSFSSCISNSGSDSSSKTRQHSFSENVSFSVIDYQDCHSHSPLTSLPANSSIPHASLEKNSFDHQDTTGQVLVSDSAAYYKKSLSYPALFEDSSENRGSREGEGRDNKNLDDEFLVLAVENVVIKDVHCGIRVTASDGVSNSLKSEFPRFENDTSRSSTDRRLGDSIRQQDPGQSSHQHGTLTRPQEGQSLISYLISQDFKTCANMEKENAHFHISEALIAAFESMQWNQTVKKNEERCRTSSSSTSLSSDEEIQELRQRIRIRKKEKMMERGQKIPSVSDDTEDGTIQDMSPPDSSTLQGMGSEEEEERKEIDVALSAADDMSVNEGEATPSNLQAMASKGLNLSMASLYSETELQRSNQQAQQRTISQQEEAALTAGSAESVAISLLKKFSEKSLPKASELKWLVSEMDAPQRLLPLPASIPVSPDDADNTPTTTQTRLRGNLEWAPPRAQIVFSIHPSEKRTAVLARQNHRCAGCGTRVEPAYAKRYRYCEYLGKYFCQCCHGTETSVIPGRVIERWDFTRYPISNFSFHLLEKMWAEPLFHIDNVNPNLYRRVRGLEAIREGRKQLTHLYALLMVCKRDTKLLNEFRRLPSHWIESDNVYSMDDFMQVKSGQMLTAIKSLVGISRQHVAECQLCQGLGFICGMCKDNRIIFPFQLNRVVKCPVCQSCYHKECFVSGKCPKCIRIEARRKQQQQPLTPMSPQSSPEWNGTKAARKEDSTGTNGSKGDNTPGDINDTPRKLKHVNHEDNTSTSTLRPQDGQGSSANTAAIVDDKTDKKAASST